MTPFGGYSRTIYFLRCFRYETLALRWLTSRDLSGTLVPQQASSLFLFAPFREFMADSESLIPGCFQPHLLCQFLSSGICLF